MKQYTSNNPWVNEEMTRDLGTIFKLNEKEKIIHKNLLDCIRSSVLKKIYDFGYLYQNIKFKRYKKLMQQKTDKNKEINKEKCWFFEKISKI